MLTCVSNALVAFYKDQFGRGPSRARAAFSDPNTLVVVLEESFTPAERNLVAMGEHQRLRDVRLFFQHASEREMRRTIEEIVGRPVRSFVSGIDAETDTSVEIFIFDPGDARV